MTHYYWRVYSLDDSSRVLFQTISYASDHSGLADIRAGLRQFALDCGFRVTRVTVRTK